MAHQTTQPSQTDDNFFKWDNRGKRALVTWLAILFGLTAIGVWVLRATGVDQSKDFSPAILLMAYASSIGALVATTIFYGTAGLRNVLGRIFRWRVGLWWYAVAVVGPFGLVLAANLLYMLSGGQPAWSTFFEIGAVVAGLGSIFAGCFGEEIGWRGFAQPLLQKRYMALTAALIVGAAWATWHLWPVITPGGSFVAADVVQTYVRLMSTAVIYAWIYNSTRGSLLLVMLAHAGHNIALYLMPAPNHVIALVIAWLYFLAACLVVRIAGARNLTSKF